MFERRSLRLPITLGVLMIVVIVALIVGWVLLTTSNAMQSPHSPLYWTLLTVGSLLFVLVLVGADGVGPESFINSTGTVPLLEAARDRGVERLLVDGIGLWCLPVADGRWCASIRSDRWNCHGFD